MAPSYVIDKNAAALPNFIAILKISIFSNNDIYLNSFFNYFIFFKKYYYIHTIRSVYIFFFALFIK
jgi:hypothetical protein